MAASRSSAARAAVDRSFEELYRGHRADVFRAALRELGNVHDAEDVTQAAFADAYRAVLRGSQPQSPRAWLLTIAENVRRRRYRTALRKPREEPTDADFPLTADLPHELARALAQALAELPEDQRKSFVLREIGGLSYDEIAEETETTVGAIQMQLFRARRSLRERLEPPTVSRRRTGLLALPGWLTTLYSRVDVALLTPRAAGAVGAAAAAVVGATVAVSEVAPPVSPPNAQARPPIVSGGQHLAAPAATPDSGRPAAVARTQVAAPRVTMTIRRPAPIRRSVKPKPVADVPAAASPAVPAAPGSAQSPASPTVTATAVPAVEPAAAETRPTAAAAAAAAAAEPVVGSTVEKAQSVQSVVEPPRLPVPVPVVEAQPVLEAPGVPPLPTATVAEVVTGAARAAGGGAQPLPVPGLPPITVPPAP